jgi:hypothetical protein
VKTTRDRLAYVPRAMAHWIWLEGKETLEFRVEMEASVKTIWDRLLYVLRAMAH